MKAEKAISTLTPISLTVIAIASELLHIMHDPIRGFFLASIIAIIWLSYYLYKNLVILKYTTKIFYDRDQATPLMKRDIRKYKHLAFIGISHRTLNVYLQEAIKESNEGSLPWESITIIFADDAVGESWENVSFHRNISDSKIKIASVLFSEKNHKSLPNFKLVSFKQCRLPYSFSGCFCGNIPFGDSNFCLEVIYSVNHLPIDAQTQKSWTVRVEQKSKSNEAHLFKELEASFSKVIANSNDLGDLNFSVWEWSYTEWNTFASSYQGFAKGVEEMVSTFDLNDKKILDIGAGTGNVTRYLINKFPKAKFTLIDDAANMLLQAKLSLENQATYELFSFPLRTDYFSKKHPNEFDFIISHLSLQSLVSNSKELNYLAALCKSLLRKGGHVLMAVHNSQDVQLEQTVNSIWTDTFRHDIETEIQNKSLSNGNKRREKLREEDIIEAFTSTGFKLIPKSSIAIDITMADRKRLWEVPAVLNSLLDVEKYGINEGKKIVEKAYKQNITFKTQQRFLTVFKFENK